LLYEVTVRDNGGRGSAVSGELEADAAVVGLNVRRCYSHVLELLVGSGGVQLLQTGVSILNVCQFTGCFIWQTTQNL
jgi:hypothetical protein